MQSTKLLVLATMVVVQDPRQMVFSPWNTSHFLVQGHFPLHFTFTFSQVAKQVFPYSFPSVPHTGSSFSGQSHTLQGHLPLHPTETPLHSALHSFSYSFPS